MSTATGVTRTTESPYAVVAPVGIDAVSLSAGLWRERMLANHRRGLPGLHQRLDAHGALDNFRRLSGQPDLPRRGAHFADSDVYKWQEAAAWSLASGPHGQTRSQLADALQESIRAVAAAQEADGYLHTAHSATRYTLLRESHELYCGGHLIQAAIALHRATGDDTLLDVARRYADHLCAVFGDGGVDDSDGHPEIEMALVELYRECRDPAYLELASTLLSRIDGSELREFWGHAVRTAYYCCGLADLVAETGDATARETLDRLWRSMADTRMYVTGGLGGRWQGESTGRGYELPAQGAYAETCAAIALVMWATRMLTITGEASYADVAELALHNGFLAGVSLTGDRWFYVNPLASDGCAEQDPWSGSGPSRETTERPAPARAEWHNTTCCPPNANRLLASLPSYLYGAGRDGSLWVHLYAASTVTSEGWVVEQRTTYPWEGRVELHVDQAGQGALRLRIPGWATEARLEVGGDQVGVVPGTYAELVRDWRPGEVVVLDLRLRPFTVRAHPRLTDARGSVAIRRGPLVYCVESVDNPGVDVLQAGARLEAVATARAEHRSDLLDGVTVLDLDGTVPSRHDRPLYSPDDDPPDSPVPLRAIPYFAWANRGTSAMSVWLRQS